jgi:hypothetical protein
MAIALAAMLMTSALTAGIARAERENDVQAPRSEDVQAPRGEDVQAPRA